MQAHLLHLVLDQFRQRNINRRPFTDSKAIYHMNLLHATYWFLEWPLRILIYYLWTPVQLAYPKVLCCPLLTTEYEILPHRFSNVGWLNSIYLFVIRGLGHPRDPYLIVCTTYRHSGGRRFPHACLSIGICIPELPSISLTRPKKRDSNFEAWGGANQRQNPPPRRVDLFKGQ